MDNKRSVWEPSCTVTKLSPINWQHCIWVVLNEDDEVLFLHAILTVLRTDVIRNGGFFGSLCEALKVNTSLTSLNMSGDDKFFCCCLFVYFIFNHSSIFFFSGNYYERQVCRPLGEVLKACSTFTNLDLSRKELFASKKRFQLEDMHRRSFWWWWM